MDGKRIVQDGYNAIADNYLATRTRDSEDVRLLEDLVHRLPRGARVLDAGCGAGIPITQRLSQSIGVDFSETQLRLAHRLVPRAQFICQDMTSPAFPDDFFDAICSYYAIIHIPRDEHRPLLLDFHRMLKPSGLAFLCLGAGELEEDIEEDYLGAPMYWSHYDGEIYIPNAGIVWIRYCLGQARG
ncbi:MAG TPA: class I SAM-dependent methyltransferase [Anaerolineae bacterium]|nr:class I SAM-dependent methyltransferase [Anaerolineae bacterium]